ncbi:transposase component [Pseudomonas sp. TCU-HL1]|nr:transposase component [Pseudomonas sp. TCU-HL1]
MGWRRRQPVGRVSTEMSLHVLAYNLKRLMSIMGIRGAVAALQS